MLNKVKEKRNMSKVKISELTLEKFDGYVYLLYRQRQRENGK